MSKVTDDILSNAMRLSAAERAELAAELLASLDGEPEADVEAAWAAEIQRRVESVRSGTAKGNPGTVTTISKSIIVVWPRNATRRSER